VGDLPQLGPRRLDVERFPAHVTAGRPGELGDNDPIGVGLRALHSHAFDGRRDRLQTELRPFYASAVGGISYS
jgi:hypothetical protein